MARRLPTPAGSAAPATARRPASAAVAADVFAYWRGAGEHTEQTLLRMTETVTRFQARLTAQGISDFADVEPQHVRQFVSSATKSSRPPELATQHARRTAVRTFFRTLRRLGLCSIDPTLDVALPPRGESAGRPLSDDEVVLCRATAQMVPGRTAGLRAVAWALGESGAVSSEITQVRIRDVDLGAGAGYVRLSGTRRHDARSAPLTEWAARLLRHRVTELAAAGATADTLLAYGGAAPPGGAKAQAAVCNAIRDVLHAAGLANEPDVRPASLRNWAGRRAYESGAAIEQVARLLGCRSLDTAAEDIGLRWRQPAAGGPVGR